MGALENANISVDPDGGLDNLSQLTISSGEDDLVQDFGYLFEGTIGDTIFNDDNQNGIPDSGEGVEGVSVELQDPTGPVIDTATTDANGNYFFANVEPGNYIVVVLSSNFDPGAPLENGINSVDPDSMTQDQSTLTLGSKESNLDQDFGYVFKGEIGDTIFNDLNLNDQPDSGEGISGVTVELRDTSGTLVDSQTTDSNGRYLFTDVAPASYSVVVATSNFSSGAALSGALNVVDPDSAKDSESSLTLVSAGSDLLQDFGYIFPGVIGDYLWFDGNLNGIQDEGETPISGVTVSLYDASGTVLAQTTTSENGRFEFDTAGLDSSSLHQIRFDDPSNYSDGEMLFGLKETLSFQQDLHTDSNLRDLNNGFFGIDAALPQPGESDYSLDGGLIPEAPVIELEDIQFNMDGRGNELLVAALDAVDAQRAGSRAGLCKSISKKRRTKLKEKLNTLFLSGVWEITWTELSGITFDFEGNQIPIFCSSQNVEAQLNQITKTIRRISRIGSKAANNCEERFTRALILRRALVKRRKAALKAIDEYPFEVGTCNGSE